MAGWPVFAWICLIGGFALIFISVFWMVTARIAEIALLQVWGGWPTSMLALEVCYLALLGSMLGAVAGAMLVGREAFWSAVFQGWVYGLGFTLASAAIPLLSIPFRRPASVLRATF